MSSKGRNYNPRHSLPPKKNEETANNKKTGVEEEVEHSKSAVELEEVPVVSSKKEENIEDLIEEIHQEVITNGFKEEEKLKNEKEMAEKLQKILGNNSINNSSNQEDISREEVLDIVVPKGIRTKEIYEKEFNNLARAVVETTSKNNDHVYKFKMNDQTGKIEMISAADQIEKNQEVFVDVNKQQVIGNMLKSSVTDATKLEVEIFVHEELIKEEFDPVKIQNLQRKVDTLKSNLEFIEKKNKILIKLLK